MEFCLVKEESLQFDYGEQYILRPPGDNQRAVLSELAPNAVPLKLEPVLEPECRKRNKEIKSLYEMLRLWEENSDVISTVKIVLGADMSSHYGPSGVKLIDDKKDSGPGFLQRLSSICGEQNLKVKLMVNFAKHDALSKDIVAEGLRVTHLQNNFPLKCEGIEPYGCEFWLSLFMEGPSGPKYHAVVTATLTLNDRAAANFRRHFIDQKIYWSVYNRSIISAEQKPVCLDLVIVVENGVEIKCHKIYLSAHSEVFRAMFDNKMKEGTTGRLEMPDMTEAGIRAFLRIIYRGDFKWAFESCELAMEVLRALHRYLMTYAVATMASMIWEKSYKWFDVDTAVELLHFGRNLPEGGEIQDKLVTKAVKVIQAYSKRNLQLVLDSLGYQDLFKRHPQVAMELTTLLLRTSLDVNEDLSFDAIKLVD